MTVFKDNIIHNTTRIDFFSSTSSSFSGRHIFFTCSVLYRSQGAQGEVGFVDEIAKLREACDQPKRKIPSKIDPFLTPTQTKHHCHTDSYPLFAPSPNFPAFQLSAFPPSGLKLLPPNFRLRTRTCERCNACNKRPSASSPMWFQAMDNSAETSGQRSIKI